jgi:hypothetical protein
VSGYRSVVDYNTNYTSNFNIGVSGFAADYNNQFGEGAFSMKYIDSPTAYSENHQVGSSPTSYGKYILGDTDKDLPLTRILPNGDERDDAEYYA